MTEQKLITKDKNTPEVLDFQALLSAGLGYVQTLSHEIWTDYNEHDPGVTILENLVFALTDIAYRTNHPITDLIASSAASTGTALERLPLFTGDRAFTTAPITEKDYRKLIYDQVADVRDVWFVRADKRYGSSGLFDVLIQTFPPVPSQDGTLIGPGETEIRKQVRSILEKNRGIGVDFHTIRLIPERVFALDLEVAITQDTDPDSCLAAVLFAVDNALNPPPEIEDVDQALYAGIPPDELFEGPKLDLGAISDDSLRPLTGDLDLNNIRAAILGVAGVNSVGRLRTPTITSPERFDGPSLPTLSRRPQDLANITVTRGSEKVLFDYPRVLLNLRHLEDKRRSQVRYAMRRMADTSYGIVPLGKTDRNLDKYRSIQHLFPEIYGIGDKGAEGALPISVRGANRHQEKATRRARAKQLKGYLLFFEQMLADHLSQLNATSDLLALPSDRPTYNWQPLTLPIPRADDPPDIAPVLGQSEDAARRGDDDWYQRYARNMAKSYAKADHPAERRGRALDHLLARFGEHFDNTTLYRLYHDPTEPVEKFENWLLKRKSDFLKDVIRYGGKRGIGADLSTDGVSALESRISLRSGHDAPLFLIEHVLLRDGAPGGGIGTEEIGHDFLVAEPPPLSVFRMNMGAYSVHWILDPVPLVMDRTALIERLISLGARARHYRAYPPGSYQVSVRIQDTTGFGADLLENFRSADEAQSCISAMQDICQRAQTNECPSKDLFTPAYLPLDFYNHAATLVICTDRGGTSEDRRAFVSEIATAEMPAHISCSHLWLDKEDIAKFSEDYSEWRKIHCGVRATFLPSHYALQDAARCSETLRNHIHRLYCKSLRKARRRRRESVRTT